MCRTRLVSLDEKVNFDLLDEMGCRYYTLVKYNLHVLVSYRDGTAKLWDVTSGWVSTDVRGTRRPPVLRKFVSQRRTGAHCFQWQNRKTVGCHLRRVSSHARERDVRQVFSRQWTGAHCFLWPNRKIVGCHLRRVSPHAPGIRQSREILQFFFQQWPSGDSLHWPPHCKIVGSHIGRVSPLSRRSRDTHPLCLPPVFLPTVNWCSLLRTTAPRKLWDVTSGECLQTLVGHTATVPSASFSPNGELVLTASHDKTAKLWDVTSGNCLCTLEGHRSGVHSATFSPDGKVVFTAFAGRPADYIEKLWDVTSGKCLRTFEGHAWVPYDGRFSHNGELVLVVTKIHEVKLWHVASGECLHALEEQTGLLTATIRQSWNHNTNPVTLQKSCRQFWKPKQNPTVTQSHHMVNNHYLFKVLHFDPNVIDPRFLGRF